MRICSVCGSSMDEGYCIGDGEYYYCTDECLHKELRATHSGKPSFVRGP